MKITLDIPNGVICAFLNGVRVNESFGMEMFSFQLGGESFEDGKETRLPREDAEDG
jgi:hypothetical protein